MAYPLVHLKNKTMLSAIQTLTQWGSTGYLTWDWYVHVTLFGNPLACRVVLVGGASYYAESKEEYYPHEWLWTLFHLKIITMPMSIQTFSYEVLSISNSSCCKVHYYDYSGWAAIPLPLSLPSFLIPPSLIQNAISVFIRLGFAHKKSQEVSKTDYHASWTSNGPSSPSPTSPQTLVSPLTLSEDAPSINSADDHKPSPTPGTSSG